MSPPDLIQFVKSHIGLCQHFSDERIAELVKGSRTASYEANEALMHFGENATFLGILLEGELEASLIGPDGQRTVLGKMKAPDTFGEMALMSGDKMVVDLIAVTPCRVLRIPLTLFQSVIMAEPRAVQHISRTISERYRRAMSDPAKIAAAFRSSEDPYGLRLRGDRPEKILIINCGSSSLKYAFFNTEDETSAARGIVDRIGTSGTRIIHRTTRGNGTRELPQGGYPEAFRAMLGELANEQSGVIHAPSDISVVGHRVVHGGERFTEAVVIDEQVLVGLQAICPLAPLHNPASIAGIREARRVFASVPHVAVFDTAFHQTLPAYAYLYGLPYEYYEKNAVRRYGFHGMSHAYVCLCVSQHLQRRMEELEIVSCHLGNGASLCAVDHGRSIDTSMGFTPGEGLIMGTRCGDLDPGALAYLQREAGLTAAQVDDLLNKKSGLLGLSGISSDMREIEKAAEAGHRRALLALKAFCYRLRKYIGAYIAAMGGAHVLAFTGGIGQGSPGVRSLAVQGLDCMGIRIDEQRNNEACGQDRVCRISTDDSRVTVLVLPTDEERMIARDTLRALSRSYLARVLEVQRKEPITIEVSAHHVHLSQEHVERLFGQGHQLTSQSELSQPGQFACKEQVTLIGPKGRVERVRVLGPARPQTQVEISMTEQFKLGIHPPIRESGDLKDTPGITIEGPGGSVAVDRGVICALRHVHMTPGDALRYGVRDKATVRVRVPGDRELVFGDVRVRVHPAFALAMHIDTDEANAANLATGATGYIDGLQNQA